MPEAVEMTTERLEADGFPAAGSPAFNCHVLDGGGALLGMALHVFTYSTWQGRSVYLEDLYVTPARRGRGLGRRLIGGVAQWAVSAGCVRLNFSVLGWNALAKEFYRHIGAVNLSETEQWESYRISGPALARLAEAGCGHR
ncbi:thialysine N-epsilon-acetyltransferase-like isoform X2 [Pollicipes pollicipes]|nr:thialysine N-epsilon-acetyltransferase-like isoform X2 [Pollicipes pollicipes]